MGNASSFRPEWMRPRFSQGVVHVVFNEDGSLAEHPQVASASSDPGVRAVASALQRAIMRCAPYRIPAQFLPFFDQWKDTLFEPAGVLGMSVCPSQSGRISKLTGIGISTSRSRS